MALNYFNWQNSISEKQGDKQGIATLAFQRFLQRLAQNIAGSVTFSELPSPPILGTVVVITNSTTNTWGAVIAGGGANTVLAWYNGTNWTVLGK